MTHLRKVYPTKDRFLSVFVLLTSLMLDRTVQLVVWHPQLQCIVGISLCMVFVEYGRDLSLESPPYIDPPGIDSS